MTKSDEGKWTKVLVTVVMWSVPVVLAIGMQYQRLCTVSHEQEGLKDRVKLNETSIVELKSNLRHIKEGVDEIKAELKK